ncbi:MAG: hypothetical protein M1819_007248 [Sarea resinae]|nr:MAG: hypothetical protein M1819_007248 [Sarea resinae]
MHSFIYASSLIALLTSSKSVYAGFSSSSSTNIAVYWGQNSYGASSGSLEQQNLATYCSNSDIDVIPMAFLTVVNGTGGQPELNFANSGNNCTTFSGTALLDCPQIGDDIATCQNTYGKTILLSIGGATYTEGGFSSEEEAVSAANNIWATFGPEQSGSSALRPFGSSTVNGFDFDFESTVTNTAPFANQLRSLMDADTSGTQWMLTAAPQCPYPDTSDNSMLNGTVSFDAIWVQFYNNYCGVQSYTDGSSTQNDFNFDTWDNWAKTVSANPNVKVLLGVPASSTAAGSGYESASDLADVINYSKTFSSFGGVMMWDASQAYANSGFLDGVESDLTSSSKRVMRRGQRIQ